VKRYSLISSVILSLFVGANAHALNHCQDIERQGKATLNWFGIEIYEAELCADWVVEWPAIKSELVLSILYKKSISVERIVKQTSKEWRKMNLAGEDIRAWLPVLENHIPDIERGDRLSFYTNEKGESYFIHNDETMRLESNKAFDRAFLGIWLSPSTSRPQMREQLLGGKTK
jgi:hypothetical protein